MTWAIRAGISGPGDDSKVWSQAHGLDWSVPWPALANRWLAEKGLAAIDAGVSYGQIWFDPGPHPAHQT